uniref:Uncharacterized protein n=1 Tax=Caenorhabditis japonica TaxID=281687 RepID=A0A8R1HIA3_CAEJA
MMYPFATPLNTSTSSAPLPTSSSGANPFSFSDPQQYLYQNSQLYNSWAYSTAAYGFPYQGMYGGDFKDFKGEF